MTLKEFILGVLDRLAATIVTICIIVTVIWPFMPDGFWDSVVRPIWNLSFITVLFVFRYVIWDFFKAAYLDWKNRK